MGLRKRAKRVKLESDAFNALEQVCIEYKIDSNDFLSYILESLDEEQWAELAEEYLAEAEDSNDDEDEDEDDREREETDEHPEEEE